MTLTGAESLSSLSSWRGSHRLKLAQPLAVQSVLSPCDGPLSIHAVETWQTTEADVDPDILVKWRLGQLVAATAIERIRRSTDELVPLGQVG